MKSNVCILHGAEPDMQSVFDEINKVALYNGLKRKDTLQLMLLSEELIGIQKGILGFTKGNFYIENKDTCEKYKNYPDKYAAYNVYFFDVQTKTLYYIHSNI